MSPLEPLNPAVTYGAEVQPMGRAEHAEYPLSLNQQQVWFECQLDPTSTLYNLGIRITVRGPLNEQTFVCALSAVIDRHDILKTVFPVVNDRPTQQVQHALPVDCPVSQLAADTPTDHEDDSWSRIIHLASRPFDLAVGPLYRAELLRVSGDLHYFVFVFHHLILDEFYCGHLMQEIVSCYFALAAGAQVPAPVKHQYGDFAILIQERWRNGQLSQSAQFWDKQVREPLPQLMFPVDHDVPPPWRVSSQATGHITPEAVRRLKSLARSHRTTPFRVVLAGLVIFFSRFSSSEEVMVDIDFSVRPREMSHVLGFFANNLPLRFPLPPTTTFDSLIDSVDQQLRLASANREFPVRQLARKLGRHRGPARPLTPVMVTQVGQLDWSIGDLHLTGDPYVTATVHALWIGVLERDQMVDLHIAFPEQVFSYSRVETWVRAIEEIFESVTAEPDVPLLHLSKKQATDDGISAANNPTAAELLRELEDSL